MATSNRDVKLTLGVETTGAEDIDKLKKSVEQLAKEGGDAAPEFQQLADEIDRLGQQATALRTFEDLARATDELKVAQQAAETSTAELGAQLATLGTATERAKTEQQAAAAKADEAKATFKALRDELQILRNSYEQNGDRVANYKSEVERLTRAKIEARNADEAATKELRAANAAVREAETAEAKLQNTYTRTEAALNSTNAALRERSTALDQARQAADQLGVSTDNVAAAQVQLVNSLNRVGTEAATVRAQTQFLAQAQDEYAAAQRRAKEASDASARAAADAARTLQQAFGTVGVRSAQELEAEIRQVRDAMNLVRDGANLTGRELSVAMASGNARIKELERSLREVRGELTLADKAAGLLKNSMGQIAAGNLIADGIGALINKIKEMGREFIVAIVQIDQMRRGLNAIYKDALTTASQINFLRKTASEAGVSFGGLSGEFVKFSAAMKGANVPIAESNALFRAVTQASAALGLGAEATGGALNALGQIASKGVVSLEELRQQLGDRLPGALGLAAKGLGITEAQLIKLVESGGLAARDFFPAFTQGLQSLRGETDGLVPTFERFKGLLTEIAQGLGDAGVTNLLVAALKILGGTVGAVALGLSTLTEAIRIASFAITAFYRTLTGDKTAWEFFNTELDKSVERLASQANAFNNLLAPQQQFTAGQQAATAALNTTSAAAVQAASTLDGMGKVAQLSALSNRLAADSTLDLGAKIVQFNVAAAEMLSVQQKQTEASEKYAKAVQTEGETLVSLAKIRGDEQAVLLAQAAAAERLAAAQAVVAENQKAEADIIALQIRALEENARARGLSAEATKVQREELEKKVSVARAEEAQAKATAEAARQEAVARKIAAESYADNSAKINEYREALAAAGRRLLEVTELKARGLLTDKEVKQALDGLAVAQARYNDALSDAVRLSAAYAEASKSIAQLELAGLDLALKQAQAAERKAVLDGNEYAAREAAIKQREIEIQIIRTKIAAAEAEAQSIIATAEAQRAELIAKNQLTDVERIRIENSIRAAEVKMLEAKALGVNVEALEKELTALRNGNTEREKSTQGLAANTAARYSNAQATNANSDALERLNMRYMQSSDYTQRQIELLRQEAAATEQAAEAKRKYWNVDKDGFTLDSNGQRMQQFVWNRASIIDYLKQAGIEDVLAEELAKQFVKPDGTTGYMASAAQLKWGGQYSTLSQALGKMVDYYKYDDAGKSEAENILSDLNRKPRNMGGTADGGSMSGGFSSSGGGGGGGGGSSTGGGAGVNTGGGLPESSRTVNLTFNLGGQSTTVGVNSEADAARLTGIFRTLEEAARRT